MSVFNVKSKESEVSKKINSYLSGMDKLKSQLRSDNELTNEAKVNRVLNFVSNNRPLILSGLDEYKTEFELTDNELKRKYNNESLAYRPVTTLEEILFYSKVNYYRDVLAGLKPQEIIELYETTLEEWQVAVIELIGLDLIKQLYPGDTARVGLRKLIEKKQQERVSNTLKSDLEYMNSKRSLYDFAVRFVAAIEMSPNDIPGNNIYIWLKMTGRDDLPVVSAEQVARSVSLRI